MREDIQDDLKFEKLIAGFNEPEKFLARQIRDVQKECEKRRYCQPISFSRKHIMIAIGGVGGISALVAGIIQLVVSI